MPTNVNCTQYRDGRCIHPEALRDSFLFPYKSCILAIKHKDPRVPPGCVIAIPYTKRLFRDPV